jgi:MYXO-CTERM domain-containing protein
MNAKSATSNQVSTSYQAQDAAVTVPDSAVVLDAGSEGGTVVDIGPGEEGGGPVLDAGPPDAGGEGGGPVTDTSPVDTAAVTDSSGPAADGSLDASSSDVGSSTEDVGTSSETGANPGDIQNKEGGSGGNGDSGGCNCSFGGRGDPTVLLMLLVLCGLWWRRKGGVR